MPVIAECVIMYRAVCPNCGYLVVCDPDDLPADDIIQCDDCYHDFAIELPNDGPVEPSAQTIIFTPEWEK